jgi:hypothetical protein
VDDDPLDNEGAPRDGASRPMTASRAQPVTADVESAVLLVLLQTSVGGQANHPGLSTPRAAGTGGVHLAAAHEAGSHGGKVLWELEEELDGGVSLPVRVFLFCVNQPLSLTTRQ